jgi:hypothetical protein
VPGLEQQTTQYPLRRQFTMVHEVFAVCQGREYNFLGVFVNLVITHIFQSANFLEKQIPQPRILSLFIVGYYQ